MLSPPLAMLPRKGLLCVALAALLCSALGVWNPIIRAFPHPTSQPEACGRQRAEQQLRICKCIRDEKVL